MAAATTSEVVAESTTAESTTTMTLTSFPNLLRQHRGRAGVSQLALSLAAGVSQRHLSYLEVGRAKPSREMTGRLAQVLGLTLAESNELLLAAGFAPRYTRHSLNDEALYSGRRALDLLLRAAEPFPAFVTDADANVIRANASALPLLELARHACDPLNLLLATFHPKGWRGAIANLSDIAPCLLRRFQRERVLGRESPPAAWTRGLALPGAERWLPAPHADKELGAVLTIDLAVAGQRVRWLSTITTLGTPLDLTLQDFRVEWFLPADDASESAWACIRQAWASGALASTVEEALPSPAGR